MKENTRSAPNLSKLLNKSHEDKWVAFAANYRKVLATSATISELIQKLGKEKIDSEKPIFYKVPSSRYSFSPVA